MTNQNNKLVFAAIDIGSNAVRLLFENVFEEKNKAIFKKGSLIRLPIRLGEDAFLHGIISDEKIEKLVKAMKAFKNLLEVYQPVDYLACATSALRNSENSEDIVKIIKNETGIKINIISGQSEAEIIYSTHIAEEINSGKSYLYIEVGGGSTEITLFSNNQRVFSKSFPIGTVRILHNLVDKNAWDEIKKYLKEQITVSKSLSGIGTGGNINFIFKLLLKKETEPVSIKELKKIYNFIDSYSLDDRIKVLGLRPDRADVILPALEIYLSIMKSAGISDIYVPNIGLADGIIHLLYEKYRYQKIMIDMDNN
jgi:exopolyphosphatase / guanosine-5'-triphosphate,3'-diphosphate pyrophosphatase